MNHGTENFIMAPVRTNEPIQILVAAVLKGVRLIFEACCTLIHKMNKRIPIFTCSNMFTISLCSIEDLYLCLSVYKFSLDRPYATCRRRWRQQGKCQVMVKQIWWNFVVIRCRNLGLTEDSFKQSEKNCMNT